jgi:hypothetical protein
MFDGVSYPVPCLPQVRLESEREAPPRKNGVCRRRSGATLVMGKAFGKREKISVSMVYMVYMVSMVSTV